jgi:hypothetical protein
MKKALPYIIGLIVVGAIGFFVYKKFLKKVPDKGSGPAALSAAAAAAPKKRSGGWRSRLGGYAKKAGAAAVAGSPAGGALSALTA